MLGESFDVVAALRDLDRRLVQLEADGLEGLRRLAAPAESAAPPADAPAPVAAKAPARRQPARQGGEV